MMNLPADMSSMSREQLLELLYEVAKTVNNTGFALQVEHENYLDNPYKQLRSVLKALAMKKCCANCIFFVVGKSRNERGWLGKCSAPVPIWAGNTTDYNDTVDEKDGAICPSHSTLPVAPCSLCPAAPRVP